VEHSAAQALRALLRWVVEASLTAIDVTELVRTHVDLDALAADIECRRVGGSLHRQGAPSSPSTEPRHHVSTW
jgi:hypothetical protein